MQAIAHQIFLGLSVAVPLALAAAYLKRASTLAKQGRPVPGLRLLSFICGMVVICVATSGPAETQAEQLFSAHMVQHLILADGASLLLVLGLTGPIMQPLLVNRFARPLRALTHPVVAITLYTLNIYLWHTPLLAQAVLHSEPLHVSEHLLFIGTGMLLWMPLFGPLPKPQWFGKAAHVIYTVGIWLPGMALANFLMWSDTEFYPDYAASARAHGVAPITDQSIAGALLMIECTVMALGIFTWVFLRWAAEDTERQNLLDLALEHRVELSSARAARAVAAGRGSELRTRIESEPHRSGRSGSRAP